MWMNVELKHWRVNRLRIAVVEPSRRTHMHFILKNTPEHTNAVCGTNPCEHFHLLQVVHSPLTAKRLGGNRYTSSSCSSCAAAVQTYS